MSTHYTSPQPSGPPPARAAGKFSPTLGLAEIVAVESMPGETAQSNFGGPEVKLRLLDGRTWYVPPSVADEIYRTVVPRQQFEVVKLGRAKHELRIVPLQAHLGGAPVVSGAGAYANAPVPNSTTTNTSGQHSAPAPVPPAALTPAAACMCAAMMAAVDAVIETQAYATRKGLGLTFGEESVRAIGLSIYIDTCRNGGAR